MKIKPTISSDCLTKYGVSSLTSRLYSSLEMNHPLMTSNKDVLKRPRSDSGIDNVTTLTNKRAKTMITSSIPLQSRLSANVHVTMCPQQFIESKIEKGSILDKVRHDSKNAEYFVPVPTDGYDHEVTSAVREGRLASLMAIHLKGDSAQEQEEGQSSSEEGCARQQSPVPQHQQHNRRSLHCGNRFGDSLVHIACRRGDLSMVQFMVDEAGCPLNVREDGHKNTLHDACWSAEPNVELIEFIVTKCPALLFAEDRRGFKPFHYARQADRAQWITLLCNSQVIQQLCRKK